MLLQKKFGGLRYAICELIVIHEFKIKETGDVQIILILSLATHQ
jgi:hypothetical protein